MADTNSSEIIAAAIGIDFGTASSSVAVWNPAEARVDVLINKMDMKRTRSSVSFGSKKRVGNIIPEKALAAVFEVKRLLGREFIDSFVQQDMGYWPFKVIKGMDCSSVIQVEHKGKIEHFTPEEIVAAVLQKMAHIADDYLINRVKNVVLTCPSHFNTRQRQALKDAGTIAGLNIYRIIPDTSAAAIGYGNQFQIRRKGEFHVLIFDLGAGFLNTSIISIDDGVYEVKATAGNTHLGGADFDNRLVDHFSAEFRRKMGKDLTEDAVAVYRLRTACEKAKIALSSQLHVPIEVSSLLGGDDFYSNITRTCFEELCMDLFRATLEPIEQVLFDSKIDKQSVNEIVLVGGSSRIPMIQSLIRDFFNGKELCKSMNPDEAVAYGAAVLAAILDGVKDKQLSEMILLDVALFSLGIETAGEVMSVLVERNTTIPVQKSYIFSLGEFGDIIEERYGTSSVTIRIFEGECAHSKQNNLLGTFDLQGILFASSDTPRIEVIFDIDSNGILRVTAKDKDTGKSNDIVIKNQAGGLTEEQIKKVVERAESSTLGTWSVRSWLTSLGLEEHANSFGENGVITVADLKTLTNDDLKELGVNKLMSRKTILTRRDIL